MADKTFDQLNPPASVTNPGAIPGFQEFPRAMHKFGEDAIRVEDEAARDVKLKAGYFLTAREAELAAAAPVDAQTDDAPEPKKAEPKKK